MSNSATIKIAKREFAEQFPVRNGEIDCARYGVDVAVVRAHLYTPNTVHQDIREFWINQLISIGGKYRTKQSIETFISDIVNLKNSMNTEFPGRFNNGKDGYDNEFRIAQAQKSLSIFLKHMWCNNLITEIPPVCPIDGVMLKYCRCFDSWTKVNSIDSYNAHLAIVENKKERDGFKSLAEWEVCKYGQNKSK